MPKHSAVLERILAIEAEMKKIGMWQEAPLPPQAYAFQKAFAMDTMSFEQWLQFVFVPRVKQIVEEKGSFPSGSMVATQAIREFDGWTEAGELISLLSEFDALF